MAALEAVESGDLIRAHLAELHHGLGYKTHSEDVAAFKMVHVIDCKSLYDSVVTSESSALGLADKRAAIECLAFKEGLRDMGATLQWAHSAAQVADGATKVKQEAQRLLNYFMKCGE